MRAATSWAYSNVLRDLNKGAIEIAVTRQIAVLEDECDLLDLLLAESGRPVTFIAMFDRDDIPEAVRDTLRKAAPLIARGARPQTSPLPLTREVNMRNPFSFAAVPVVESRVRRPIQNRAGGRVRRPCLSHRFREDLKTRRLQRQLVARSWCTKCSRPSSSSSRAGRWRRSARQGKDGVDTFLDLTLEDDLEIEFTLAQFNTDVGPHSATT